MDRFKLLPCPFCGKKLEFYQETHINSRGQKYKHWYFMHDVDDDCVLDAIFNVFTIPAGDANPETGYPGRCGVEWNKRASGWIPCSERMPEPGVNVLVTDGINQMVTWHEVIDGKAMWVDNFIVYVNVRFGEVTHWMPLPEPPGGGHNDD